VLKAQGLDTAPACKPGPDDNKNKGLTTVDFKFVVRSSDVGKVNQWEREIGIAFDRKN